LRFPIDDGLWSNKFHSFQEYSYAKRELIFIGGQVEYTCRRASTAWREDSVFEDQHSKDHGAIGSSDKDPNEIGEFEQLILAYSGLSLTFHTDIYHAFAGMTRYFKIDLQANLCHGIPDKYFDWFLLWQLQKSQTRRNDAPSWSWSGWDGESGGDIWDWYENNIKHIQRALRKRTWVIWYQRKAHDSEECTRILTPKPNPASPSRRARNFYGGYVQDRFQFDCTQTTPTPRTLIGAPTYIKDNYHPNPGSGFLQFWTVSAWFKLKEATSQHEGLTPVNGYSRLGIFGKNDREMGIIFVNPAWCKDNVPKFHEFILICEGRDKRVEDGHSPNEFAALRITKRGLSRKPGWRSGPENGGKGAQVGSPGDSRRRRSGDGTYVL